MTNSFERIERVKANVVVSLTRKGVDEKYLRFGGPGERPARQPRVPTAARSEFLANRAMGDWAESTLAAAITEQIEGVKAEHYGDSDRVAAGEEGFRDFYLAKLEEVRLYGKRPDLLILPQEVECPPDMPAIPTLKLDNVVRQAITAVEVRSSKFEAETYMGVKRERAKSGRLPIRECLSFTVKVEDLVVVYRWMERTQCPQIYAQVFFDSVYAINFASVFEIIASGNGFVIESPEKSQQKSTIMIPITSGQKIAEFICSPTFVTSERITTLGRHDAFVRPTGGKLRINSQRFYATIDS